VPTGRGVATPHLAADQADTKVNPVAAGAQTLLTALGGTLHFLDRYFTRMVARLADHDGLGPRGSHVFLSGAAVMKAAAPLHAAARTRRA